MTVFLYQILELSEEKTNSLNMICQKVFFFLFDCDINTIDGADDSNSSGIHLICGFFFEIFSVFSNFLRKFHSFY